MVSTNAITSATGYYEETVQKQKNDNTVNGKNNTSFEQDLKSGEDKYQVRPKTIWKISEKLW